MTSMASTWGSDLEAMRDHVDELKGTITAVDGVALGTAVAITLSPVRRERDTQEMGSFTNYDFECVGLVSDFETVPSERSVLTVTCSGLSLTDKRFFIEMREVDSAGFRFQLKRQS